MKKVSIGLALAAVLVFAYIVAAPYITVHQMKAAARNRDGEALSEHVDFVALRQNLKEQLNAMIGKEMINEADKGNGYAALGGLFAGMIVEKMVDNYVTPTAITMLMEGDEPGSKADGNDPVAPAQSEPFSNVSMSYDTVSKFSIVTTDKSGKEVKFILRRRGIDWKLTEIVLPI